MFVPQSCPSLCDPTDCSPTGSTVHGILQGRILEWVAMPFSRGSSETWVSCIAGRFSIIRATREAQLSSVQSLSRARLFATLWTVAHQASLSMGFSREECWSGLPCPSLGDLPDPGIELTSLMSPALAGGFFNTSTTWKAY